MTALFLSNDLLFSSKVTGTAAALQLPMELGMSAAKLLERAAAGDVRLVILDLSSASGNPAEWIPQLRAIAAQCKIVAFGPHVQDQMLMAAHQAGCDEVLTRGQFNMDCANILRRYLPA
jgi:DNA-binding NarL/FixJ family response regulator